MVDNKRFKEVSSTTSLETATYGSLPSTGVDGVSSPIRGSQEGVLFVTITDVTGSAAAVGTDNAAAAAAPTVSIVGGLFRSTLPTYTDGDAAVLHFDSRGRLLVSPGESGLTADIDTDQAAGPATPVGQYIIGKRESTLPTYADGENSVFHFDARGRLIVTVANPTTGASPDIDTDDSAATTNPSGTYSLNLYEATLPSYTDGDAAAPHADARGRTLTRSAPAPTGTTSNVAGSASNVTLLAANTARIGALIFNDSTADLYVKFGATASTTSFTVKMIQDAYLEVPANYTGIIDGVWGSATGFARVTEVV